MVNISSQCSCSTIVCTESRPFFSTSAQSMKCAVWKPCTCKWQTQRLSSTEEFGRCACLTMFPSICVGASCLCKYYQQCKTMDCYICVASTYTSTTSLRALPPGYIPQEAVHTSFQHWIYPAVCCSLWKTSVRKQKMSTTFQRCTVTFPIVKLWGEKTTLICSVLEHGANNTKLVGF